ncbi:MAG: histidine phosphatase family protein [Bacillota bacterium]|nr:histidine phosphatase family protein [Bacillota bacterium]MDW7678374.1 histidine phosphatase family protein [Bacillota bacterium]
MTKVFLMRHGQTRWNLEERFQGSGDSPLTEEGKLQAVQAAERLKDLQLAAVYSSPRKRAIQTAMPVAQTLNLEVIEQPGLEEIALGEWEGKMYSEIKTLDPEGYHSFFHHPELFSGARGGESLQEVKQRSVSTVEELAEKHSGQKILVVSHAVTIRLLLTHYLPCSINDLWNIARISQTSLSEIKFDGDRRQVGLIGCTDHLSD